MDSTGNWCKPGKVSLENTYFFLMPPNLDLCDAKCLSENSSVRRTILFFRGHLKRNAMELAEMKGNWLLKRACPCNLRCFVIILHDMENGKVVNMKLHTRRSQRTVKGSRSICRCDCWLSNCTVSNSIPLVNMKSLVEARIDLVVNGDKIQRVRVPSSDDDVVLRFRNAGKRMNGIRNVQVLSLCCEEEGNCCSVEIRSTRLFYGMYTQMQECGKKFWS